MTWNAARERAFKCKFAICQRRSLPPKPIGCLALAADQFFDEPACPIAHFRLDRIKPIVEKLGSRLRFTLRGTGLRDSAGHGVVSDPAL